MQAELVVFDLDGTLIDSKLDLVLAVNATRNNAGLTPLDHETISSYVGDGAPTLIRRALGDGATDGDLEHGLQYFLDYYRDHMLDNTRLYPGVREGLDELRKSKTLAILTNKPVRFSELILEGLGVGGDFQRVYGGNSFETKKPDPFGLNFLMREFAVPRDQTLIVGDSSIDIETARNAGVASCGVTYGLRPDSFKQHPPDLLIDRFPELLPILLNGHAEPTQPAGPSPLQHSK